MAENEKENDDAPSVEPKPLWNSLEIAKIAVGALTPILLFSFGVVVTLSNTADQRVYEKQLRDDATAREEAARRIARADAKSASELADRRALAARQEAFRQQTVLAENAAASEAALQVQADERDARLRAESQRESRRNRILDRRMSVWNKAGPALNAAIDRLLEVRSSNESAAKKVREVKAIEADMSTILVEISAYDSYFSEEFVDSARTLRIKVYELGKIFPSYVPEDEDSATSLQDYLKNLFKSDVYDPVLRSHKALIVAARRDLAFE